ncbi:MAG: prolipoprotein diacylglyceryl transferase [Bacteroidales bacterium]|nr:prolipoprotein diacylglyceryl transferase [Bacteroidales bacterium]MCF8388090.1 prolipoprotein diacylglyceryl transferase [Bacteroidales bacterium]
MYPKLSDMINDLFGTNINLPIQSYGFFVALAFLLAGYLLYLELKRKEKKGLIIPQQKTRIIGRPASVYDLVISFVIAFFIGLKFIGAVFNYSHFADQPQQFIFSWEGSWIGALLMGAASSFYTWWKKNRQKLDKPKTIKETVHSYEQTGAIVLVAAIAGIVGAKIFHQFENWDDFIADPLGSLFSFSGLTFYGGLIVAAFAVAYYAEKNNIRWLHIADSVAPSLILAYGVGRIGCQVSGDGDWGIVNTTPRPDWLSWLPDWAWAYDYPHNVLKQGIPIEGCTGEYCYRLAEPVFPTPIYETTMCILIFVFLWSIRKKLPYAGMLFSIYLILNGIERFLIEKIRVNTEYQIFDMRITQAEIISLILFILGIIGIFYTRKHGRKVKLKREKDELSTDQHTT